MACLPVITHKKRGKAPADLHKVSRLWEYHMIKQSDKKFILMYICRDVDQMIGFRGYGYL